MNEMTFYFEKVVKVLSYSGIADESKVKPLVSRLVVTQLIHTNDDIARIVMKQSIAFFSLIGLGKICLFRVSVDSILFYKQISIFLYEGIRRNNKRTYQLLKMEQRSEETRNKTANLLNNNEICDCTQRLLWKFVLLRQRLQLISIALMHIDATAIDN